MTNPQITVSVVVVAVSGVAHWAVARWLLQVAPSLQAGLKRRVVVAAAVILALFPAATRVLASGLTSTFWARVHAVAMSETAVVVLSAIPLTLFAAIGRRRSRATTETRSMENPPAGVPRRMFLEQAAGASVLAGTGLAFGWGATRGRHAYEIREVVVPVPGLPRVLEGYSLAQVSDLHVGTFVGEGELRRGLALVAAAKPDLLVATGDLVDMDPRFVDLMARYLADHAPRDGAYAILGNHDYYAGADDVAQALRRAGVRLLLNQGVVLRPGDGGGFALLGVDDSWGRRRGGPGPNLEEAIAMVPDDRPRILLAHQPDYFDRAAGRVALQLSGHTHGGQLNPGFRPADLFMKYVAGPYARGGSRLYVNRGFGTSGPPARIGAPPEITKIIFTSA